MQALYVNDFPRWLEETIDCLEKQNFESLDLKHLIEELIDLGRSDKRAIESNLMILMAHLLQLTVQKTVPETMKGSSYDSVIEHRQRVLRDLQETPSLKTYLETAVLSAYPDSRKVAIKEGKLARFGIAVPPESAYPLDCPFTLEQLLDEDFLGS